MEFDYPERNIYGEDATRSCGLVLYRAFQQRGCHVEQMGQMVRATKDGNHCFIHVSDTSFTSTIASKIWNNKSITRKLLRRAGISVARGRAFARRDVQRARNMVERMSPVVVKPVDGMKGRGVSVNVTPLEFDDAWAAAKSTTSGKILIEKFFDGGNDVRYLVVDNKCVGVGFRFPPTILGDGVSTVSELVEIENQMKLAGNPSRVESLIEMDSHRRNLLTTKGLTLQSVLKEGQRLNVDEKANVSAGGDCYEAAELVHESYKKIAERVAMTVPGSHVVGVDIMAHDHSVEATEENHVVLEVNTTPGIYVHIFPDYGTPNDVAMTIVDSCLEKMASGASL